MKDILDKLKSCIETYEGLPEKLTFDDGYTLSGLLRGISSQLFYLESYRDDYKRQYDNIMYNLIKDNTPVSKSEIIANKQVPEIYMLRRIMTAGYRCQDAIRSNLSYIKKEQN